MKETKPKLHIASDQVDAPDKTLKLTLEQYETLQRFWWALAQFHSLLDEDADGPSDAFGIILEYPGAVFEDLDSQQMQLSQDS